MTSSDLLVVRELTLSATAYCELLHKIPSLCLRSARDAETSCCHRTKSVTPRFSHPVPASGIGLNNYLPTNSTSCKRRSWLLRFAVVRNLNAGHHRLTHLMDNCQVNDVSHMYYFYNLLKLCKCIN